MRKIINKKVDIYDYLTNRIIELIEKEVEFNDIDREKLYLGVITLLINGLKISFIALLAAICGIFKEIMFMMIIFALLRLFAAGLHARKSYICTIVSIVTYFTGTILSINFPIKRYVCFPIYVVLMVILIKFSPADTENRPIIGAENRRRLKRNTFIVALSILFFNLIVFNEKLINLTMYSMVTQIICVLPFTYKILNRGYKNYEKYE